MKVLAYSDVHLDWTTGGVERFDELCRALEQVFEYARDNLTKDDVAIFLGDLCDPDIDSPLCIRAIAQFLEFGRTLSQYTTTLFLVGNHDVVEDGRGTHTLMALSAAGLQVFSEPRTVMAGDGVGFVLLPYASQSRRYDPAKYVASIESAERHSNRIIKPRAWVVAGHMTRVPGVGFGSETTDMPRGSDMDFPLDESRRLPNVVCLNGHFHQRVVDGPVLVPGSLARLTHGEEKNTPGFLVVEV